MEITEDMIDNNLDIAVSNYDTLINYYTQQKENFLRLYSQAMKKEMPNTIATLYATVFKELSNFENRKAQKYTDEIFADFKDSLLSCLSKEDLNSLKKFKNELEKEKLEKKDEERVLLNSISEQFYNSNKIEQLIKDFLYKNFSSLNNNNFSNPKQFVDYLISYRNNIFYHLATEKNFSTKDIFVSPNYKHGMKGYMQEAAAVDAFSKLTNKLSDSEIGIEIKPVGSKNNPTDIEIIFKIPEHLSVTGEAEIQTFGIQSKSWIVPWDKTFIAAIEAENKNLDKDSKNSISTSMDLGNKKQLLDGFKAQSALSIHSWSNAVRWLSEFENAKEATDNVVLWNTGHKLFWADSLIKQQIRNGRYIAFPWSKKDYAPSNARLKWNTVRAMNRKKER